MVIVRKYLKKKMQKINRAMLKGMLVGEKNGTNES